MHVLFEHSTGLYLFHNQKLTSHLPLTQKQTLSFLKNDLNILPTFLNSTSEKSIIVDKSLNNFLKKFNFNPINDPEAMREIRMNFHILVKNVDDRSVFGLSHLFSREKVEYDIAKEDNFVMQCYEMIELLENDVERYGKKIKEMYGYHFPELEHIFKKNNEDNNIEDEKNFIEDGNNLNEENKINEKNNLEENKSSEFNEGNKNFEINDYFTCVNILLNRKENLLEKIQKLKEKGIKNYLEIQNKAETSIGSDLSPEDTLHIFKMSELIISKNEELTKSLSYLQEKAKLLAPNLCALLGLKQSARMICKAGGLYNLAKCPSSTLQLLGAEKALFRALKAKTNTPKYGTLYESVKKIDEKERARVARFLASKCSIAARIDFFSKERSDKYGKALAEMVLKKVKLGRGENTDVVLKRVFDALKKRENDEEKKNFDDIKDKKNKLKNFNDEGKKNSDDIEDKKNKFKNLNDASEKNEEKFDKLKNKSKKLKHASEKNEEKCKDKSDKLKNDESKSSKKELKDSEKNLKNSSNLNLSSFDNNSFNSKKNKKIGLMDKKETEKKKKDVNKTKKVKKSEEVPEKSKEKVVEKSKEKDGDGNAVPVQEQKKRGRKKKENNEKIEDVKEENVNDVKGKKKVKEGKVTKKDEKEKGTKKDEKDKGTKKDEKGAGTKKDKGTKKEENEPKKEKKDKITKDEKKSSKNETADKKDVKKPGRPKKETVEKVNQDDKKKNDKKEDKKRKNTDEDMKKPKKEKKSK